MSGPSSSLGGKQNMPQLIQFEIPAKDPGRTVAFYHQAFGWQAEKWGEASYWLLKTGLKSERG